MTDRLIRVTPALPVVPVAGVAAIISYQHSYELVTSHGETGPPTGMRIAGPRGTTGRSRRSKSRTYIRSPSPGKEPSATGLRRRHHSPGRPPGYDATRSCVARSTSTNGRHEGHRLTPENRSSETMDGPLAAFSVVGRLTGKTRP